MTDFSYPALLEPNGAGGFVISFRDIPEALAEGDTVAEAVRYGLYAVAGAVNLYMHEGRAMPTPSAPSSGETLIPLPAAMVAKILLHRAMREAGIRPADLARKMKVSQRDVSRLLDICHESKINSVEKAVNCLGYRLNIGITPRLPD